MNLDLDDEFDNSPVFPNDFQKDEKQESEIPNINPMLPRNKTTQNNKRKKLNLNDTNFFNDLTINLNNKMKILSINTEMIACIKKKRLRIPKKKSLKYNNNLSKKSTKNGNSDEKKHNLNG